MPMHTPTRDRENRMRLPVEKGRGCWQRVFLDPGITIGNRRDVVVGLEALSERGAVGYSPVCRLRGPFWEGISHRPCCPQ
jgi:hypothetical protein